MLAGWTAPTVLYHRGAVRASAIKLRRLLDAHIAAVLRARLRPSESPARFPSPPRQTVRCSVNPAAALEDASTAQPHRRSREAPGPPIRPDSRARRPIRLQGAQEQRPKQGMESPSSGATLAHLIPAARDGTREKRGTRPTLSERGRPAG